MTLVTLGHIFAYEMECLVRLFYPGAQIHVVNDSTSPDQDTIITQLEQKANGIAKLHVSVTLNNFTDMLCDELPVDLAASEAECERRLGLLLFTLLHRATGCRPAWGILTGVRPVRLCGVWARSGLDEAQILARLTSDYLVTEQKARLCLETGRAQEKILAKNAPDRYSLYVAIPFCPTRCLYCSFVSHAIDRTAKLVPEYVGRLCEELRATAVFASRLGLKLQSIYIGGGTPTTLEPAQLRQLLAEIQESFDLSGLLEYTVEAGRPDTVTVEKLAILRKFGVGRVSINPQTMNDDVLVAIGRRHSSRDIEDAFGLARQAGFGCINMDLIAGLPGDTLATFARSVERLLALGPENITVHALTVKRSSHLREKENAFTDINPDTAAMQDYAAKRLYDAGFVPYYLYRQKATVDNLENIGYAKPGFEGIYNVYSMEDNHNILAAGAGGVSKLIAVNGKVKRIYNYKYPYEYLNCFAEILKRKSEGFYAGNQ